ncbi:tetratricopeptide repeat protein [Dactylosporangium sp. NPDC049525]|uniref:ATP-binding protein n=1 Tax=Dactylosporangium sp. NPDC049525 TaxID=3154730 RepID=UPI003420CE1E
MRALPRPTLPPGPLADLFDELHQLHHRAGWPSLRRMAAEVGCSHTTIATAFSGPRPPRWGLLELIVEALGGDPEHFRAGWLAATQSDPDETTGGPPAAAAFTYVTPRDLPAPAAPFIGRAAEFALLDEALAAARAGDASNVVLIAGPPGVGKTSLAVAWSHTVADRHPDGQLHLDLRGYDVSRPRTPSAAADAVLRRLGVEASALPRELSEKSALLRSHLADRQLLMVLDNAHSADQVWPLLPGPSCFVVITSRDSIPGLVARTGARRVLLDRLDAATAAELLTRLLGAPAHADPDAVRALAVRCAYLPLALRVAAEVVTQDPQQPLAEQVARFDRRTARLDLLDAGGDERTAVRSVFSWSLRRLSAPARNLFELLGLSPARHLDDDAAAALLGAGPAAGAAAVGELLRAHLVERRADTFGLHDLLRDYVVELAATRPEAERRNARLRLFEHYVAACRRAVAQVRTDPDAAWLRRHRSSLVAVARSAAQDSPALCLELASLLHGYLEGAGHYSDAIAVQRTAIEVARRRGDAGPLCAALCRLADVLRRAGALTDSLAAASEALTIAEALGEPVRVAGALQALAAVHVRQGHNELGSDELGRAAGIFRDVGDRAGEAAAANRRGIALMQLGRLTEALQQHERAYTVYRDLDLRLPMGRAANNLGVLCVRLGRYDHATAVLTEALGLARSTGNRAGVGVALANLGDVAARQGRWQDAAGHFRQAVDACEQVGYLGGLADARRGLGLAVAHLGDHDEGLALLHDALRLGRRVGDADIEAATLIDIGHLHRLTGKDGSGSYRSAFATTVTTGDLYQRARALDGQGHCARDAGHPDRAAEHWRAALELFERLGVPEAATVRAALADL